MNKIIANIEQTKTLNSYYCHNSTLFDKLLAFIKTHKRIKFAITRPRYLELYTWINTSTPLLISPVYNVLTKIYWILHDIHSWNDTRVICTYCKKPFINKNIYRLRYGYPLRCSVNCMNKSPEHIKHVNDTFFMHVNNDPLFLEKRMTQAKQTNVKNGHPETWVNLEKIKSTKEERYGDKNYNNINKQRETRYAKNNGKWHADDFVTKNRETCLKNNGYECSLSHNGIRHTFNIDEIRDKAAKTMKKNKTYKKSKTEDCAYNMLCAKFGTENIIRQYKTPQYPFNCDFYISILDLYIEFQGSWTHGYQPYDESCETCIKLLEKWKAKSIENQHKHKKHDFYKTAIYVWTQLDVKKRTIVKDNQLNFKEFFTLDKLDEWLKSISV